MLDSVKLLRTAAAAAAAYLGHCKQGVPESRVCTFELHGVMPLHMKKMNRKGAPVDEKEEPVRTVLQERDCNCRRKVLQGRRVQLQVKEMSRQGLHCKSASAENGGGKSTAERGAAAGEKQGLHCKNKVAALLTGSFVCLLQRSAAAAAATTDRKRCCKNRSADALS
eukprot:scaffold152696_cov19-Tisochrysis_lutea.AAC.1